ncbi:putative glucuronosyltransferase PGSIP8 [Dichanthelium oligosanthes]|uniref:Putative glucuronosyltransferase PGSIP8 n=1 Tax=Dichanthelium oligosanthes TaxID=888268 RepID=A0A1E5W6H9_9POAL|nr:putative glucuronosyltransferase PGSIP8 [Dichanthelium oligosanthes]
MVGAEGEVAVGAAPRRHAYAAMMYMGTPRDYEFYVATRVMMGSLRRLSANADRVVIASLDVPPRWAQALKDDGVKVVSVENLKNPYEKQENFNMRFNVVSFVLSSSIPVSSIQASLYFR